MDAKQTEFGWVASGFIIAGNKLVNKHREGESDFREPAFSKHIHSLNDNTQLTAVLR
jgi:hypothetical protein